MAILSPIERYVEWEKIKSEFEWINAGQGQSFVQSYIANHPSYIDAKARLAGIEVYIPPGKKRADLVLITSEKKYYVVEAKDREYHMKAAVNEAKEYSADLERHLNSHQIQHKTITPVGAVLLYPDGEKYGPEVGQSIW